MSKVKRKLPKFRDEKAERKFWESHDSTEYVDWSRAKSLDFPNLHGSTVSISLRLPAALLAAIRSEANRRDVPYQSLMKVWLAEHAEHGRKRTSVVDS